MRSSSFFNMKKIFNSKFLENSTNIFFTVLSLTALVLAILIFYRPSDPTFDYSTNEQITKAFNKEDLEGHILKLHVTNFITKAKDDKSNWSLYSIPAETFTMDDDSSIYYTIPLDEHRLEKNDIVYGVVTKVKKYTSDGDTNMQVFLKVIKKRKSNRLF